MAFLVTNMVGVDRFELSTSRPPVSGMIKNFTTILKNIDKTARYTYLFFSKLRIFASFFILLHFHVRYMCDQITLNIIYGAPNYVKKRLCQFV